MTTPVTEVAVRFTSTEAARGSRVQRLNEIDVFWRGVRDDITAQRDAEWSTAISGSCARIAEAMAGLEVTDEGVLVGNRLRARLASLRILAELDVASDLAGIQFRAALSWADAKDLRDAERAPFDFGLEVAS